MTSLSDMMLIATIAEQRPNLSSSGEIFVLGGDASTTSFSRTLIGGSAASTGPDQMIVGGA